MIRAMHRFLVVLFLCVIPFCYAHAGVQKDGKFMHIQVVTSKSGITAWLFEDHTLPIIAVEFMIRDSGSAQDPQDKQGLSLLASNMFDEGAGPYDSQAFQKMLEDNSITLRFNSSRDAFGGVMQALTRKKDLGFKLFQLAINQPRFDAEPLARMKAANITRIRSSMTDPDWIAARIMNSLAFEGHPYALNAGGTLSTLRAITPDDLKTFARTRLTRDRLVVAASGDITPEELKTRLDDLFASLPPTSALPSVPEGAVKNGGTVALYKKDIPQTILSVMQPGIDIHDPDYHSAELMNFILGGSGFGSRLMTEIREKRGLSYGIYTGLYDLDHLHAISGGGTFENKNAAQVIDLLRQQWQLMRDKPVDPKELQAAKSYLIGSMPLSLSTTDSFANMLANMQMNHYPIDYLDKRASYLNAVTAHDVQRVAQRLLQPDKLTVVLVGNPENVKTTRTFDTVPNVE